MRIIHIADIHWRGLSRHEEYVLAFNKFFKKAKTLKPDVIYVGGDIVHSKTQGISPELIQCLAWWFNKLAEICPTHVILGNHDGLILNKDRQDAISPIINAIQNPNIFLYKKSGVYATGHKGFNWCVFSCFDEEGWVDIEPEPDAINIALYHGAVRGSLTDTDWQLEGEINISNFDRFDFGLFGDIHKRQFLNHNKTAAYCGSTIQQNYGEDIEKGFLLWDIRSKDDFSVEFHEVAPVYPYTTVPWKGDVQSTLEYCKTLPRQCRIRVRAENFISQSDAKRLQKLLKKTRNAKEVVFKVDSTYETEDAFDVTDDSKINLRDAEVHKSLLKNYYKSQNLTDSEWTVLDAMTEKYIGELSESDSDRRHVKWSINKINFDNTFSYGEENSINFDNLGGITGIFGRNARGKSSIVGTIAYSLFNTTDRGSIKNIHIINTRKSACKASIDISINGAPYRIIRQTIKKQTKKNVWAPTTLKLYRLDRSGEIQEDLTEEQRRETEKILRNLIGTADEFLMTSLASQGEMNTFIKEKAAARKTILANFLDLDVFDKIYEMSRKDSLSLRNQASSLGSENWQKLIETSQERIDHFVKSRASIENDLDERKIKLKALQKELHSSGDIDLVSSADIERAKKAHLKIKNSLDKKLTNLENLRLSSADQEEKIKKLQEFLDSFDIETLRQKRNQKNELERNLIELKGIVNLEKKELTSLKRLAKKLEPCDCFEHLPSCKYMQKSDQNKKKMDLQERKVMLSSVKLDDIQKLFDEMIEDYDEKISKHSRLVNRKSKLISEVSDARVETQRLESAISNLQTNLNESKNNLEDLVERFKISGDDNPIAKLKVKIYELEKEIRNLDIQRTRVINKLADWKAKHKINKSKQEEYHHVNKKLKIYDLFTQASSKRGIPVQIINTLLPKINSEITKILQGVVGFSVELEADLDSNAMDVYINYGDSRRIVELGSGMEKMMAALAIRVALINVSSLPKTSMLIIDEGFGALDETNLESCGKLLQSLKKWFKNILVISHIDAIKDIVDNNIDIVKKGQDSYVYQP